MQNGVTRQTSPIRRARHQSNFAPAANAASYMDLLKFEQRMIQNVQSLDAQRRKYSWFVLGLSLTIAYYVYRVFLRPSIYPVLHYIDWTLLLVFGMVLVLFFATGTYAEKMGRAYKYVPQANRSIRPYNMYLNAATPSILPFPVPSFHRKPGKLVTITTSTIPSSPPRNPQAQQSSPRQPLTNIPPPSNPKGELMFSSRIDPNFIDGYTKFRNEWHKRRAVAHPPASSTAWLFGRKVRTEQPVAPPKDELHPLMHTPSNRGRDAHRSASSTPSSSRRSSPAPRRSVSPLTFDQEPPRLSSPHSHSSSAGTEDEIVPPTPPSYSHALQLDVKAGERLGRQPRVRSSDSLRSGRLSSSP